MKYISSVFLVLILSSCKTTSNHGQFIDDKLIKQLESKNLTKSQVEELLGTPTIIPEYTPDTYYYIENVLVSRVWFTPKISQQRVVKIIFNHNDKIDTVEVLNENNMYETITPVKSYTKAYGTELNGIQKFVKNIGRFNKSKSSKRTK